MTRTGILVLGGTLLGVLIATAGAAPARADVLELKDGRLVEGLVIQSGDRYVVHSRFGPTEIAAADVKSHSQAPSVDERVRAHLATLAPDDAENRAHLAEWLNTIGRAVEGLALAEAVLDLDPENARARHVLGHIRHRGVWCTPDEARQAEGLEKHGERWYTPQEWKNLQGSAREEALEAERRAEAKRFSAEVNRAVRLMMSPDKTLRERGRKRLQALAREYDKAELGELVQNVDAYVKALDEMAAAASGLPATGGSGYVMGEFRATVSRLKRPIETFTTSLASNIGGAPIRIQLPELEVIRVRTTGVIPVVVR